MEQYFFQNLDVDGFGGVVAAPDNNTKGGSYWYHWMRDAAITMHVVQTYVEPSKAEQLMQSYVKWVVRAQSDSDPNGIDVRGEPKFFLPNGGPFTGGWCRPQNDGAGLRAWALGQYALSLIANGRTDFVRSTLFGSAGNGTVRRDCDYVTTAWQQTGNNCDLWEEMRGDFFFTKMAQRRGLLMCQQVAKALSDPSADGYGATAKQIQASLDSHWNGQFLFEASNRQKDSAVILGLLYGDNSDGYLPLTDPKVTATVTVLNTLFQGMFPLNAKDDGLGIGGIFWGRYEGDNYAGGHPWVLSTAALADVYYRQAKLVLDRIRSAGPTLSDAELSGLRAQLLSHGRENSAKMGAEELARALALDGDGVMQRIRYHVAPLQFHLPEQLDKETGGFANAHDLTWSYGSVFLALHSRAAFYAAL